MPLSILLPKIPLTVTPEQFAAIAAVNPDLHLEKTLNGELIVNPPTGSESGKRNFSIVGQLFQWCEAHPELGEGFDSSTGFDLPNGSTRSPDASWVSGDRWEALTPAEKEGFAPLCPDFVVELRSKTDSLATLQEKMREYIDNGARLGWLIDPQNRRVEIYRSGDRTVEILEQPATLSGEKVLPGFMLSLTRIWS
jgi:Uma2 family endonuclease